MDSIPFFTGTGVGRYWVLPARPGTGLFFGESDHTLIISFYSDRGGQPRVLETAVYLANVKVDRVGEQAQVDPWRE